MLTFFTLVYIIVMFFFIYRINAINNKKTIRKLEDVPVAVEFRRILDLPLSKAKEGSEAIQIKPQRVSLKLRIRK